MSLNMPTLVTSFMAAHKTLAKLLKMPYGIGQGGVAVILPSSGSIGNNGALTLTTALPYIVDKCYMYFPANAIAAGVAAGLYYVEMSSTTAGIIYNNTYSSGSPTLPSKTAFATTGPGAYTQTTGADLTLISTTLAGGAMGINGSLAFYPQGSIPNNANTKTLKVSIGGVVVSQLAQTTIIQENVPTTFRNRGAQNSNVSNGGGGGFSTSVAVAPTYSTIDTSSNQTVLLTARLANALDYLVLESGVITLSPSN
jgi:hypothetical protein